jgi:hypothetical protein
MLPLTLTFEDYSKTEKIRDLPKKLMTEGALAGADPSVGDIAYYGEPRAVLQGLYLLGRIDSVR